MQSDDEETRMTEATTKTATVPTRGDRLSVDDFGNLDIEVGRK